MTVNATTAAAGSSSSTGARASSPTRTASSPGISSSVSTLISAGKPIPRKLGAVLRNVAVWPFSIFNRIFWRVMGRIADTIWGKGRTPVAMVEVEFKGWFGSRYIERVALDTAIEKGYYTSTGEVYTPEYAKNNSLCNDDYIKSRGWNDVEFKYIGGLLFSTEYTYKGALKAAIEGRYITPFQAIKNKLFTEQQAIAGKWITKTELDAHNKAAAEKSAKANLEAAKATKKK